MNKFSQPVIVKVDKRLTRLSDLEKVLAKKNRAEVFNYE